MVEPAGHPISDGASREPKRPSCNLLNRRESGRKWRMKTFLSTLALAWACVGSVHGQTVTASYDYVIQKISSDPTTNGWSNGYRRFSIKEGEALSVGIFQSQYLQILATFGGSVQGEWNSMAGEIPGPAEVIVGWRPEVFAARGIGFPTLDVGQILGVVRVRLIAYPYPANKTIIIPAGSKGGSLDLEMSTDLVNWTPTIPGTYTSPTNNLFFRLYLKSVP